MSNDANGINRFSYYGVIYTIILVVAVLIRFLFLGNLPLHDGEASLALQSFALSKGQSSVLTGEPGYISLTTLQFIIFGASEFMARFWPAFLGACIVLLPLVFRPWLGQRASLWLAGFIALDPILIGISRSAEGSTLALVGLFAGIGFFLRRKPVLAGICLGAALAGGPQVWIGILLLVAVFFVNRNLLTQLISDIVDGFPKRFVNKLSLAAVVMLAFVSTIFGTHPVGISAIGSSVAAFFGSIGGGDVWSSVLMFFAWIVVELPLIVPALWGLIESLIRRDEKSRVLGVWWGLALILAIFTPANGVNHFFWASLPMLLLAALKVTDLICERSFDNRLVFIAETVLVVALIVFSLFNVMALVNNNYLGTEETRNRIIGALLPVVLLAILTILLSWGWSVPSTRIGFITGIMVLLVAWLFANSWKAAGFGSRPQFEVGDNTGYAIGSDDLISTISDISLWNTGQNRSIDILMVSLEQPSLVWALRDFGELSMERGYNPNLSPSLILTGINQNISSIISYRGQKIQWSVQPDLSVMTFSGWVKWAVYRVAPVRNTEIILWARNDLFSSTTNP